MGKVLQKIGVWVLVGSLILDPVLAQSVQKNTSVHQNTPQIKEILTLEEIQATDVRLLAKELGALLGGQEHEYKLARLLTDVSPGERLELFRQLKPIVLEGEVCSPKLYEKAKPVLNYIASVLKTNAFNQWVRTVTFQNKLLVSDAVKQKVQNLDYKRLVDLNQHTLGIISLYSTLNQFKFQNASVYTKRMKNYFDQKKSLTVALGSTENAYQKILNGEIPSKELITAVQEESEALREVFTDKIVDQMLRGIVLQMLPGMSFYMMGFTGEALVFELATLVSLVSAGLFVKAARGLSSAMRVFAETVLVADGSFALYFGHEAYQAAKESYKTGNPGVATLYAAFAVMSVLGGVGSFKTIRQLKLPHQVNSYGINDQRSVGKTSEKGIQKNDFKHEIEKILETSFFQENPKLVTISKEKKEQVISIGADFISECIKLSKKVSYHSISEIVLDEDKFSYVMLQLQNKYRDNFVLSPTYLKDVVKEMSKKFLSSELQLRDFDTFKELMNKSIQLSSENKDFNIRNIQQVFKNLNDDFMEKVQLNKSLDVMLDLDETEKMQNRIEPHLQIIFDTKDVKETLKEFKVYRVNVRSVLKPIEKNKNVLIDAIDHPEFAHYVEDVLRKNIKVYYNTGFLGGVCSGVKNEAGFDYSIFINTQAPFHVFMHERDHALMNLMLSKIAKKMEHVNFSNEYDILDHLIKSNYQRDSPQDMQRYIEFIKLKEKGLGKTGIYETFACQVQLKFLSEVPETANRLQKIYHQDWIFEYMKENQIKDFNSNVGSQQTLNFLKNQTLENYHKINYDFEQDLLH